MQLPTTIADVFPWGRSYDEYCRMFALSEADLELSILGCGDGPAAFNAEMTRRGKHVISCDPLYVFDAAEIESRIDATHDVMVDLARQNAHRFVWDRVASPEEMGRVRMNAMRQFIADYDLGPRQGRYLPQSLPRLDFPDGSFDLAICSPFLFLYSDEFDLAFHLQSILEMCRVAREVRVFPLLDMRGNRSAHLNPLLDQLSHLGFAASIERVPYEFQRGGHEMLRVR